MIGYSQCWEDAEFVIKALQINPLDTVLSVTSGGCNALALASSGAKCIYSVDRKMEQNFLLDLKQIAIKNMEYEQVLEFLGYRLSPSRLDQYKSIAQNLLPESKKYWDSNGEAIKNGVVHCGKFERYLWTFRNIVLPLVHCKKKVNQLLNPSDSNQQIEFYKNHWNTCRWRLMFKIFFSRFVMSRSGRSQEMFAHSQALPAAKLFFNRTEQALMHGAVSDNFYLSYVLLGKRSELLPYYLQNDIFKKVKDYQNLNIINCDILSFLKTMPNESVDKFNLSDIFEPISAESTNTIFNEIYRTAKPSARIIFWNNLVRRDIPEEIMHCFERDYKAENKLRTTDKVFFYEKFFIYTVVK